MLITHFNKLIRSKLVLIILAFIVCFTFVGVSVLSHLSRETQPNKGAEGVIFNKEIPSHEFRLARYFELGMRNDSSLSGEENKLLRRRTWERLAALETAHKMQISASEDEMVDTLKHEPAFQVKGVFSKDRFRYVLSQINATEQLYTEYLKQEIVLQKLMSILQSSIWIPPAETQRRAAGLIDSFVLEYVQVNEDDSSVKADVSIETAELYYNENQDLFQVPEKISVKYADFPASEHLAAIEVNESETERFYYDNIDDYSSTDTNNNTASIPLADVRDSIVDKLKQAKALDLASNAATDFVMKMTPGRSTPGLSIEQAAADAGISLKTSVLFSAKENVPGIDAGTEFNSVAFSLDPADAERSFSDAIAGRSNVYVIAINERVQAHIPAFADIKDKVFPLAEVEARRKAAEAKAIEVRNSIVAMMSSNRSFTEVAQDLKMNVFTTETFTVYGGILSNQFEYSSLVMPKIMSMSKGDVTEPVKTGNGAIIATVAERISGDAFSMQTIKPQIIATMEKFKTNLVLADWLSANLENSNFKDNLQDVEPDSAGQSSTEDAEL